MSKDALNLDFELAPATQAGSGQPGRARRTQQAFSLEWAAGFADGEGCIHIFMQRYADPKRKKSYRLGFTISQNDLQVLEHFQQGLIIAERIYKAKRLPSHNRQVYTLNCTGRSALRVIAMLEPHLVRKQLQARAALDYWRLGHGGAHPGRYGWPASVIAIRERFYQKLKALK